MFTKNLKTKKEVNAIKSKVPKKVISLLLVMVMLIGNLAQVSATVEPIGSGGGENKSGGSTVTFNYLETPEQVPGTWNPARMISKDYIVDDGQMDEAEIKSITDEAASDIANGQVFIGWGTKSGDPQSVVTFPYAVSGDTDLHALYVYTQPYNWTKNIIFSSIEKVGDNVLSDDTKTETITYKVTVNESLPESVRDSITIINTPLTKDWLSQNNTKDEDGNWIVTFTAIDGGQGQSLSPTLYFTTSYRTKSYISATMPLTFSENIYKEPEVLSAKFNTDKQKLEITYANGDNTGVVGKVLVYSSATKDYVELPNSEFNFTKDGDVWTASLDPDASHRYYRFSAQAAEDTEPYVMDTTVEVLSIGINDPETDKTIETLYGANGDGVASASKLVFPQLPSTQEEYEEMFGELPEGATFGNISEHYPNEVDWLYKNLNGEMYMPVATNTQFYAIWKYGEQVVYPYISYEVHFDVNDNGNVDDGELLKTSNTGSNRSAVNVHEVPALPENTRTHEYKWEDEEGNQYTASQVSSVDFVGERTTLKPVEIVKENPSDFEAIEFGKIFDNTPLVVTNDGSSENDIITAFKAAHPEIAKEAGNDLAIEINKPEDVNHGKDTHTYEVENVKWKDYENRNTDKLTSSDIGSYVLSYNVIIGEKNGEKVYATNAQGEKLEGVVEMTIYPRLVSANAGSFVTIQGANFMMDQSAYEGYGYRLKHVTGNWVGFIADSELATYYSAYGNANPDFMTNTIPFLELTDYDQSPIFSTVEWASPSITLQHPSETPTNELTSDQSGQLAEFVYPDTINMKNYFVKETVNPMYILAAEDFADEKVYDGQEYTITAEELMATEGISSFVSDMRDNIFNAGYEDQYDVSLFFWDEDKKTFTATEYTTPSANVDTYEVPYKLLFTDKEGNLLEEEVEEIGNQVNAYTATIDITPIDITITAADFSKTVGEADPANFNGATLSAGKMVNGESFDFIVTRAGTSQVVGIYVDELIPGAVENGTADTVNYRITVERGNYTIIAGPVVIPPVTPPGVTPPAPAAVVPPVVIPDVATPLADGPTTIEDTETPLAGGAAWSLLDLILTVVTGLIAVSLLVTYFTGRREEEEEEEEYGEIKRKGLVRILSIVPIVGAIILFILTQDMTQPMIIVDEWTIVFAAITLVQGGIAFFSRKKVEEDDDQAMA